jgi:hypothetical protein
MARRVGSASAAKVESRRLSAKLITNQFNNLLVTYAERPVK